MISYFALSSKLWKIALFAFACTSTSSYLVAEAVSASDRPEIFDQVQSLLASGEGKKAVKLAEKATEKYPELSESFSILADSYGLRINEVNMLRKLGIAKKMLNAYERAFELDPNNPSAVIGLYEYYRQAPGMAGGDKEKAQELLPILVKVDPLHAAYSQGMMAWEEENWNDALQHLTHASEIEPDNRMMQYLIGKLAAVSGENLENGASILSTYLETPVTKEDKIPTHDGALWRLGLIREHQGRIDEAIQCFEKALSMDSDIEKQIRTDLKRVKDKLTG